MGAPSDRDRQKAPGSKPAPSGRRGASGPSGGVLALQRMAGNAATAQLVQKRGGGKKAPAKEKKPAKKYHEISGNARDWSPDKLRGWAGDAAKDGRHLEAAAYYQLAYEKGANKNKQDAIGVQFMFRTLKDQGYEDDYKYWTEVVNGTKKHPLLPEFQHA